ncbi:hypothetical protein ACFV1L_12045 [Kitasatospora sp. NPDC059646]|uniref:hypothetical protein n=1 Tax=Kitasatospora sp. NPDC059646 TaxID=3346893 RepID=UPI0036CFEFE6
MGVFDTGDPVVLTVLGAASAAATVARAWIRHRTAIRLEQERTRRVLGALTGTTRQGRAEVVRACAELEATASRPGNSRRTAGR